MSKGQGIGIYCTVSKEEYYLALLTLERMAENDCVSCIIIVITDSEENFVNYALFNGKAEVYSRNFGSGYDLSLEDGGYDQIGARNFALELLEQRDCEWILQHDADEYYTFAFLNSLENKYQDYDALLCSCITLASDDTQVYDPKHVRKTQFSRFINPHVRIWRKSLSLRFEKSPGVERRFKNVSRHCGVNFKDGLKLVGITDHVHYHFHYILKKRHYKKLKDFEKIPIVISGEVRYLLTQILDSRIEIGESS
jgi:hypothetical protein